MFKPIKSLDEIPKMSEVEKYQLSANLTKASGIVTETKLSTPNIKNLPSNEEMLKDYNEFITAVHNLTVLANKLKK